MSPSDVNSREKETAAPSVLSEPTLERNCPVCRTTGRPRLFAEAEFDLARLDGFAFASRKVPENMHLRLHECGQCDTLYASPVFAPGTLAAAYRDSSYDSSAVAQMAAQTYATFLPALTSQLPNLEGALDVGAGDGAFVAQLVEHGFSNVVGVEPSLAAIAKAPREIRSLIRTGMFAARDFEPASFSLVTCFQTIEHVDAPLDFCREAWQLLRPGGALLLIGHNRRAVSARLLGRKSPIFDIEHLQLFSPRSLKSLLEVAGFQNVRVSTVVNRYPLSYWGRLFPLPGGVKSALLGALEKTGLGKLRLSLPAGNIAAVGFKP
jgi:SAM-dependent methyltransferase